MMYLRVLGLVWLFNHDLGRALTHFFLGLVALVAGSGSFFQRMLDGERPEGPQAPVIKTPLELRSAFVFAASHPGRGSVYPPGAAD
jgi:hypothetical protein